MAPRACLRAGSGADARRGGASVGGRASTHPFGRLGCAMRARVPAACGTSAAGSGARRPAPRLDPVRDGASSTGPNRGGWPRVRSPRRSPGWWARRRAGTDPPRTVPARRCPGRPQAGGDRDAQRSRPCGRAGRGYGQRRARVGGRRDVPAPRRAGRAPIRSRRRRTTRRTIPGRPRGHAPCPPVALASVRFVPRRRGTVDPVADGRLLRARPSATPARAPIPSPGDGAWCVAALCVCPSRVLRCFTSVAQGISRMT